MAKRSEFSRLSSFACRGGWELKNDLASKFVWDRKTYTAGKGGIIKSVLINLKNVNKKTPQTNHIINEIMANLVVYQEPNFLKEEYSSQLDLSKTDPEAIKKYWKLLSNLKWAWEKTLRYQKYFEDFYPCEEKIEKIEALNHHIHAYLEDLVTFQNKIETLLYEMKKDLKKIASNPEEIEIFFVAAVKKTNKVFNNVSEQRNPHRHQGARFFDGDLLKAENANSTLAMLSQPIFASMLNPEHKQEFIENVTKEKEESFETAKAHWIETSKANIAETSGYLGAILESIQPSLYDFLQIKSIKQINEVIETTL